MPPLIGSSAIGHPRQPLPPAGGTTLNHERRIDSVMNRRTALELRADQPKIDAEIVRTLSASLPPKWSPAAVHGETLHRMTPASAPRKWVCR